MSELTLLKVDHHTALFMDDDDDHKWDDLRYLGRCVVQVVPIGGQADHKCNCF